MGHHHAPVHRDSRRMRLVALAVIVPAAVLTIVALVILWPSSRPPVDNDGRAEQFSGVITGITKEQCPEQPEGTPELEGPAGLVVNGCGTAQLELTSGPDRDRTVTVELPNGPGAPAIDVDDSVQAVMSEAPEGRRYDVIDHQRGKPLWILGAAFAAAVIAFGRWRGVSALVGLAATFALLLLFVVPAILEGQAPLLVAIVGSAAIMLTVLYLTHGVTFSTSVAVMGTLASLVLTGALAWLAVTTMHLTGFADDSSTLLASTHQVNLQGLLLAGIIIGTLGVLDDVTITQAATVTEVARADPGLGVRELYRAGTRVGRAHVASVINTIILAYAGSSLPLLILITASNTSIGEVLTTQVVTQEIVRSIVATLGLIAAVPITTALAALTARRAT